MRTHSSPLSTTAG